MNPTIYIWSYQEKSMNSNVNEFVINTWKLISTQINESTCHCQTKHVNACPDKTCRCYSRQNMSLLFQVKHVIVIPDKICHCYSKSNISFQVRRHYHYRPNMSFHVIHVIIIPDKICHSMSNMYLSFQTKYVIPGQICHYHFRPNKIAVLDDHYHSKPNVWFHVVTIRF